ncbi:60S ribosomal protein l12 [Phtheirospermum japonicum]|uniref:60S ribosomal protein l12 n=1 Tax=Phtheirospermum japonicum TaxID=374723 RepID=A0A830CZ86_9LAMI|nr:60S ribosomal protein l12 [Phtheirospermum japonicum]
MHSGNISLNDMIEVPKMEILETCVSIGCTMDGKDSNDMQQEILDGDVEIPQD